MLIKERYKQFIKYFLFTNPNPKTELKYNNNFELLIAVILSAQCMDKRVNIITKTLFKKYNNPYDIANASINDIFFYIKSISYPNSKTKYLIELSKIIVNKYSGQIPDSRYELMQLPGVGRKTANVILSIIYNKPVLAVDRHVARVSTRIGLVSSKYIDKPLIIEQKLSKNISKKYIIMAHNWLVLHGRYICTAKNPKCITCGINHICCFFTKNIINA